MTVDSPHSPPRRAAAPAPDNHLGVSRAGHDRTVSAGVTYDTTSRPLIRPTTPLVDSSGLIDSDSRRTNGNGSAKSASVPPPINRADKPKIPPKKPSTVVEAETAANVLMPSQNPSVDQAVSPFNTPPSSPERPSGHAPSASNGDETRRILSPPYGVDVSQRRSRVEPISEPPQLELAEEPNGRTAPVAPNRTSRIHSPLPPPTKRPAPPPPRPRNSREPSSRHDMADNPENRPGLPPRFQGSAFEHEIPSQSRPPRPRVEIDRSSKPQPEAHPRTPGSARPSIQTPSSENRFYFPPPPRRDAAAIVGRVPNESPTGSIQPTGFSGRSTDSSYGSPASGQRPIGRAFRDESDESSEQQLPPEEAPLSRTDYPDFTHTNRRAPSFRTGARAVHTKHDTRVFDVCGQYACTTGFFTRVWDLTTGEQIMSLNHGENLKGSSVAFKPGHNLNDEGNLLWLGTNIGEIHEIDISTQSIVSSRSTPSRREIIKIYRHKKELWTVDDAGELLLWPPDESGTPNIQYSYSLPYDRVAKGHTFSMVVGDLLWHATGKEVRIYRPNTKDTTFQVLRTPLGAKHSGEVTSGTVTSKQGGRVYLGHADGKVTIYSTKDFSYLGTVNVSLYKINCLAVVGDYLWAGYKTGMIYVYDTTTSPWMVKKDWHAHEHAVCGLMLDPTALWTVNKLQVVTLGADNYIRIWDGMLEDDWLGSLYAYPFRNFLVVRSLIVVCRVQNAKQRY